MDRADSKGLNEWERQALELAEERSNLAYGRAISVQLAAATNGLSR